jgi:hypothetical protein
MSLNNYLELLAEKHGFNLDRPGQALQIEAIQSQYGPLTLCVWNEEEERYTISRIIFTKGGPTAGFTVWLDHWGEAVRAVNDFRSNVGDLALAEAEMCALIERLYLDSNQAEQVVLP